jgi:hypothetical protein
LQLNPLNLLHNEAVVGGTISVIGGGKFANGAQTGAVRYLFNETIILRLVFVIDCLFCVLFSIFSFYFMAISTDVTIYNY